MARVLAAETAAKAAVVLAVVSAAGVALGRRVRATQAEAAMWREATREPDLR